MAETVYVGSPSRLYLTRFCGPKWNGDDRFRVRVQTDGMEAVVLTRAEAVELRNHLTRMLRPQSPPTRNWVG